MVSAYILLHLSDERRKISLSSLDVRTLMESDVSDCYIESSKRHKELLRKLGSTETLLIDLQTFIDETCCGSIGRFVLPIDIERVLDLS